MSVFQKSRCRFVENTLISNKKQRLRKTVWCKLLVTMSRDRRSNSDQYYNDHQLYHSTSRQLSTNPRRHRGNHHFSNHRHQHYHNEYDMNMNRNIMMNINMNRNDEFNNSDHQYNDEISTSQSLSQRVMPRVNHYNHSHNGLNQIDIEQQYQILQEIQRERQKLEQEREKLKKQQEMHQSFNQEEINIYKSSQNARKYTRSLPSQVPTATEMVKRKHVPNAPQLHKLREQRGEELGYIKVINKSNENACPGKGGVCGKHGGKLCRHIYCFGCNKGISSASAAQTTHHFENAYHTNKGHLEEIKLSVV